MKIRSAVILSLLSIAAGCQNARQLESSAYADTGGPQPQQAVQAERDAWQFVAAAEPAPAAAKTGPASAGTPAEQPVPPPPAPAPPDAAAQLERLVEAVQTLQQRVAQLQAQNDRLLAALGMDAENPNAPPASGSLASKIADLQQAVILLSDTDAALRRAIDENRVTLRPQLPEPSQGRLIVDNNTGSDRQVWINGTSYWIWAGSSLTVNVPVGEVTTKVPGEEAKTWQIQDPRYQEHIELVRAEDAAGT